jgi:hypothetical protein
MAAATTEAIMSATNGAASHLTCARCRRRSRSLHEEESEVLPKTRQALDPSRLNELGQAFQDANA